MRPPGANGQERPGAKVLQSGWVTFYTLWQWGKAAVSAPGKTAKRQKWPRLIKVTKGVTKPHARGKEKRQNLDLS